MPLQDRAFIPFLVVLLAAFDAAYFFLRRV
jgi:hypothetical protein